MISETYFAIFAALAIFGLVAAVATVIWLWYLLPPRVEKKYRWIVRTKCKIPFVRNWEANIDAEDIEAFRRYRLVIATWCAVAAVLVIVEYWIWLRMMQSV